MIASLLSYLMPIGIAIMLGGDFFLKSFGLPEPQLYTQIKANKLNFFLILFLLNTMGASMLKTGAFEIILDGMWFT